MHYVECIHCGCYSTELYSVTIAGDHLCEACTNDSVEVERKKENNNIVYVVSNEYLDEMHCDVCDDFEQSLIKHNVTYTRVSDKDDLIDTFTIPEAEVIVLKLAGVDLDTLF